MTYHQVFSLQRWYFCKINDNFAKVHNWALYSVKCKMTFNPDISRQAHEVIFSRKLKKTTT